MDADSGGATLRMMKKTAVLGNETGSGAGRLQQDLEESTPEEDHYPGLGPGRPHPPQSPVDPMKKPAPHRMAMA